VEGPGRLRRTWRGRPDDPAWIRPSLIALLAGTCALYAWNLSASGWANSFYSAAAQAGSVSWKAFLFGSSDASNAITVDKPPLSLWPMALAIRVFGLNSWSILVPQALMGVATVGVLYASVRRWFSPVAGLLAGLVMALTPVAALMFRFNNPDALLTLLMTVAAYTALRAVDDGRLRWFLLTGTLIGLGFLTKQLQVLLVVPGFGLAYLVAGPARFGRRVLDLLAAFVAMLVSAGWWVAVVELWPADSRPYIGGSQNNSIVELTLGYNGLGRLTGEETGSVGGGAGGGPGNAGGMWGQTGLTRLLDNEIGGQVAWLLPAALAFLVIGLWLTRRAARTDLQRASLLLWGGWLAVTALTFSYMSGIFHAYYTVALAPAIGALVGIGATLLWDTRAHPMARVALGAVILGSALWAGTLLERAPSWNPWLADLVVIGGFASASAFVASALGVSVFGSRAVAPLTGLAAAIAIVVLLAAPGAWSLQTVATGQRGSLVTAGPTVAGSFGPGGQGGPAGPGAPAGMPGGVPGALPGGPAIVPGGGVPGLVPGLPGVAPTGPGLTGGGGTAGAGPVGGPVGGPGGGMGGLLDSADVSDELAALLEADADHYTWVAATTGSQNASGYQLATEAPVMAIGGFNGSDPSPTLEQFQDLVAAGEIHWYLGSGISGMASMGGSDAARAIASWVATTYEPVVVDGVTLYDLTARGE
jgi:4-amino-4-deoxy-L-arabinose transferase-like glycosyltransferase